MILKMSYANYDFVEDCFLLHLHHLIKDIKCLNIVRAWYNLPVWRIHNFFMYINIIYCQCVNALIVLSDLYIVCVLKKRISNNQKKCFLFALVAVLITVLKLMLIAYFWVLIKNKIATELAFEIIKTNICGKGKHAYVSEKKKI